jgi:anti-anti-sigma regulatory factor
MASNFGITIDKNNDGFGLKLEGDFDATSACELIYAIKKLPEDTAKLYIYTNGLKAINPFGLDIFHKFMRSLNGQSAKIVFTGNSASRLSPGNSRLTS